jgi:hypothetical protein
VERSIRGFPPGDFDRVAGVEGAGARGAVVVPRDLGVVLQFDAGVGEPVGLQGAVQAEGGFGAAFEIFRVVVLCGASRVSRVDEDL